MPLKSITISHESRTIRVWSGELGTRTRSGKKRTWWPWSLGWLGGRTFFVWSHHSSPTLKPNGLVGDPSNVPMAGPVPAPFRGRSDWASAAKLFTMIGLTVPVALSNHFTEWLTFCVWYAATSRTVTGLELSDRTQYGDSTSSPTASRRPPLVRSCPGLVRVVR